MIIVADTSPIMNLAVIGHMDILQHLYEEISIPEGVRKELMAVHIDLPHWINVHPVAERKVVDSLLMELDFGEAEAIALANDLKADLLLIDERRGRQISARFGLAHMGLLGVLVAAKRKGLIDEVKSLLDALLIKAGFWISKALYDRILCEVGEADQQ